MPNVKGVDIMGLFDEIEETEKKSAGATLPKSLEKPEIVSNATKLASEPLCWGRTCKDADFLVVPGLNYMPIICNQAPLPGADAEIIGLAECPRRRWKMFAPSGGFGVGTIVTEWSDK